MTKIGKLKRAGIGLGLVGLVAFNQGCATTGDAVTDVLFGQGAQALSGQAYDGTVAGSVAGTVLGVAGSGMVMRGQLEAQKEVAREGRSEVNVYVDGNQNILEAKAKIIPSSIRRGESAVINAVFPKNINNVVAYADEDQRMKFKLRDDGLGNDLIAGDGIWTYDVRVPYMASEGNFNLVVNGYENDQIKYTGKINFSIVK